MSTIDDFSDGTAFIKELEGKLGHLAAAVCAPELPSGRDRDFVTSGYCQWQHVGADLFAPCGATTGKLTSGAYVIDRSLPDDRPVFRQLDLKVDDLVEYEFCRQIMGEINSFWTLADDFKANGFLHRRGYMFYGPAGSGKSCIVQLAIADVVRRDGVVLVCDNVKLFLIGLAAFRQAEPNRRVVCLFEDIDAIINSWGESVILSILDGENQIDGVLNIATTNYPERLDRRLVARPRRFDRLVKVDHPNEEARRIYFTKKLPMQLVDKWVEATKGLSFAALAEAIISIRCLGNDFDLVIAQLKDMSRSKASSEEFNGTKTGFVQ